MRKYQGEISKSMNEPTSTITNKYKITAVFPDGMTRDEYVAAVNEKNRKAEEEHNKRK